MPRTCPLHLRSTVVLPAVVACTLAAGPAAAAMLLPGAEISPTGIDSAGQPQRSGVLLADTRRPFAVPDGRGGTVRGYLQDTVSRSSETGTLVFAQRLVLDPASSTWARPAEWSRSGMVTVAMDADYRSDGPGTVALDSMQRSPDGDRWRSKLARPLVPGESSRVLEAWTNGPAYDERGSVAIVGPNLDTPIVLPAYRPVGTPQPYYTVTALQASLGWVFLNDHGQVSLSLGDTSVGLQAAVWQPDARNAIEGTLHLLPRPAGFPYSQGHRINNLGQVAATAFLRPDAPFVADRAQRGFVFTPALANQPSGSVATLPLLPGGTRSTAWGINDYGQVSGGADHPGSPPDGSGMPSNDPVLWSDGAVFRLGAPIAWGEAWGINNNGAIAGLGAFGRGVYQGYVWTPDRPRGTTGTARAVDVSGAPWPVRSSYAWHVNDAGTAVGTAEVAAPDGSSLGVRGWAWSPSGYTDLGVAAFPYGIDRAGVVVGSVGGDGALFRDGVATKLRYFAAPAQRWLPREMLDINGTGQMVGFGGSATVPRQAVLLTPVRVSSSGSCPATRTPFTLALGGTGFAADAVVRLNGQPLPTTRIDSRTLTAAVPAGLGLGRPNLLVVNGDGSQSIPVSVC